MANNPFRLTRFTDLTRKLHGKYKYSLDYLKHFSAVEKLEIYLATLNDDGFEYEVKNGDKTGIKRDYPYLAK